MNESIKKIRKELAFSSLALAERKIATEIIEKDSIRLIPTIPYLLANVKIINTLSQNKHDFVRNQRISVDLSTLKDGLYAYVLSLVDSNNNSIAKQEGLFVMSAGFSREYNIKWGDIA